MNGPSLHRSTPAELKARLEAERRGTPFLLLFALLWFCFAPRHARAHCGSRPRQDWAGRRTVD